MGAVTGGACGYNSLPTISFPSGYSVATGGDAFDNGYGCGACFEVTCVGAHGNNPDCICNTQKKVIVQATDRCPGCGTNHFDLNPAAFGDVVGGSDSNMAATCGVIETKIRRVSCDFQGNIKIRSKSGTSGWWYGLHLDDVAGYGAVSSIKLREAGKDGFDIVCDKSGGPSYWLCNIPNTPIFIPLDVSITDSAGRELTQNSVIDNLDGDLTFDFGTNFGDIDDDDGNDKDEENDGGGDDNNSSPVCEDDPNLRFKDKKKRNCNWVGANKNKRCKKQWKGKKLKHYCPEACDKC